MAVLQMTSDASRISLTVRGEVGRAGVEEMRAALTAVTSDVVGHSAEPSIEPPAESRAESRDEPTVELDLREVTDFPRLGIALLVAARRFFGDRLRIRGNETLLAMLDEAGLTRVLRPGG